MVSPKNSPSVQKQLSRLICKKVLGTTDYFSPQAKVVLLLLWNKP